MLHRKAILIAAQKNRKYGLGFTGIGITASAALSGVTPNYMKKIK